MGAVTRTHLAIRVLTFTNKNIIGNVRYMICCFDYEYHCPFYDDIQIRTCDTIRRQWS